ncbi:uncharacterized protein si:dkeyp-69c1.9 [Puntigrus tetrazona]|uniref:uncharacterized protein si:dkeyp-69c1.9 n=1 Tax=Puntigrus tetrazona TaxID=1606681 RepID=UPI001C88EE46|nr:uncharacterized protein si:dkeyp-69c1.9 [Puntigrus tetrazona]XP_043076701.1 uncharacterized protein si:dkeyp-69c1.9 [Puntigrus tetrazona]
MATREKTISKQQRPSLRIPFGHRRRTDVLFLKNGQITSKHPRSFPMLGELPSLAGLLLYPGKREKMVTTTETEFGPKTCLKVEPKKILQCNLTLDGDRSFNTTNREDYPYYTPDGTPIVCHGRAQARESMAGQAQRCSLYQHDFPAPKRVYVRRNQVVPHPDNLAINTSMRAEYKTVQKEAFPDWNVSVHARPPPARLRRTAAADG